METRRNPKKKELVKIKEEQVEYDPQSSSNNGSVSIKEESMNEEKEPVEEQYIEISTNLYSKTDQTSNEKSKALTKEETKKLLGLILLHPIIISKETKATNNQQKIKEWNEITEQFNATCSVHPRTPKQLRLKWENLKKNARRWRAKNKLNREKPDLTPEYMQRDEILEKVSTLLRRRRKNTAKSSDDCDSDDSDIDMPLRESVTLNALTTEVPESEEVLLPLSTTSETNVINHKAHEFPDMLLRKKKLRSDEGREARNGAIAGYYAAKTKLLEANLINVNLQNEKLRIEIELLKRKTNQLKP